MDFYAMLHAFALIAVMYKRRRKAIAEIWPKYCCFLACMLTFQYFVCIGIPPAACKGWFCFPLQDYVERKFKIAGGEFQEVQPVNALIRFVALIYLIEIIAAVIFTKFDVHTFSLRFSLFFLCLHPRFTCAKAKVTQSSENI